jgi:hypothetical protein
MNFVPTDKIHTSGRYLDPKDFFQSMGGVFDTTRSQILNLETRQEYYEENNISLENYLTGKFEESRINLPITRLDDVSLYYDLIERGVDFIRCRPLKFPLNDYSKWELNVFKFNPKYCERIFCCNYLSIDDILINYAKNDFMVFDSSVAYIHDYNNIGKINGGWIIDNIEHIIELQKLFIFIKSQCQPFEYFLNNN